MGQTRDVGALVVVEPRGRAGLRVLLRAFGTGGRRDDDVDARVRQHPLQERLRPRVDAPIAKRGELLLRRARAAGVARPVPPNGRMTTTATPSSSASGSRRFSASCSRGLSGSWTTSKRRVRSACSSSPNEPALQCVDADAVDAPRRALLLEPREVLLPGDEVVHLLDLDATEGAALLVVLRASLLDARRPDLRRDVVSLRRESSAAPSDACARPYIGDESKSSRRTRARRRPLRLPSRRLRRTSGTCLARPRGRAVVAPSPPR